MSDRAPLELIGGLTNFYGLIASSSKDIQMAGFGILHRAIPATQEKLSVDILLENKGEWSMAESRCLCANMALNRCLPSR